MTRTSCEGVVEALRAGTLGAVHAEHAANCKGCSLLLGNGAQLGRVLAASGPSPAADQLVAQVLARVRSDRAPKMTTRARQALVWGVFALPIAGGAMLWTGAPPWCAMTLLVVAAWGGAMILRPVYRPAPAAWLPRLALLLLAPSVVALVWPFSAGALPDAFVAATVGCFAKGSLAASVVFGLVWATDRRPVVPLDGLAAAVGLGALAGAVALELACPMAHSAHRLLGHGGVGLVLATVVVLGVGIAREARLS